MYSKIIEVRWSDLDANGHVTHTAYGNFATHTRTSWMAQMGYPIQDLIKMGVLAVATRENIEYHREVFLNEQVKIVVYFAGASQDHTRWKFRHEIYKETGKIAAINTIYGAWIDSMTRKVAQPPQQFINVINTIERYLDFEIISTK